MSTKQPIDVEKVKAGLQALRNCACIGIHFTGMQFRRKIDLSAIIQGKRAKDIHTTVNLINPDAPEFKAIKKYEAAFRAWVRTRALPAECLPSGTYMIPFDLVEQVIKRVEVERQTRYDKTDELLMVYEDLKGEALDAAVDTAEKMRAKYALTDAEHAALREVLCDPKQYPTPEEIRQAFDVTVHYYDFNVPQRLAEVNAAIHENAVKQFNEECASLYDEVRDALRCSFKEMIAHMVERLGYEDNGKPKVFRDTMVEKLEDFLKTFEARNLTQDGELQKLVGKARQIMNGVSPQTLRDAETIRSTVQAGFQTLKAEMDKHIIVKPARKFNFGTEE